MIQHEAYELISQQELPDIHSTGYLLRHKKSGAHVTLVSNEDENKVFYIGFRTPVEDSTGVPHIIEHSTLCGSDKYPVKDPFVELVKGSLNTFLNAMTYPDKTVYPVASYNDKDFANLMDVYMDAVFHPNIYHHPEIFQQEGWHYEMEDPEGEITVNGVVYNEMKGAFSSPESMLQRSILNSLFPDTGYAHESGGDPADIPKLTYEQFLDFHRRYYHPSNSYIYLYGDMDFNERLDYLDREYLSHYDRIDLDSAIIAQEPFDRVRDLHYEYAISEEEEEKDSTYLSYNFVVDTILNPRLYQAFDILSGVLLNNPGAPVWEALLNAGIGKDISGGYDAGTLQPYFSFIVKGANPEDRALFVKVVDDTLAKVVAEGLDHEALISSINLAQFNLREADFGRYPKGLIYGLNLLDSWLYDSEQPFLHMNGISQLDELRDLVETGYFESLVDQYFCKNHHATVLTLKPRRGLTTLLDEAQRQRMAEYKATLTPEEIDGIIGATAHLKEYQATPSSKEELATIPLLRREDLRRKATPLDLKEKKVNGHTVLFSDVETSGISYLRLVFDAKSIAEEDLPLMNFLAHNLGMVNTQNYTYTELTNQINLHTGGIFTTACLMDDPTFNGKPYLICSSKYLYDKAEDAFRLIRELLMTSDFSDKKRLKDLVSQEKAQQESFMSSQGHMVAAVRGLSTVSQEAKMKDDMSGITYYRYLKDLEENFEDRADQLIVRLHELMRRLFTSGNLLVSITGRREAFDGVSRLLPDFLKGCFPDTGAGAAAPITLNKCSEGFKDASQIQYVARVGNFKEAGFEYTAALHVLKVILGYDYFWINVRVKGGAYGCMSSMQRNGDTYYVSYRDPNLAETNEIFEHTARYIAEFDADERDMTKYIIGTISDVDTPLTPTQKGRRALAGYLNGWTLERAQKGRDQIIDATAEDIRALAPLVQAVIDQQHLCVVGCEANVEAHSDLFDEVSTLL